tara:strand:+ start:5013 stop:5222 length:210 start_codon:yes stop_codon:yes gene_type:complete
LNSLLFSLGVIVLVAITASVLLLAYIFAIRANHFYKLGKDPIDALRKPETLLDILKDGEYQQDIEKPQW